MSMEYKEAALEFKAGAEPGTFTGYGAMFENLDDGNDIIKAGAFTKIRTKSNGKIRIPLYHDMNKIVGEGEVVQDGKGLSVKGQLNMALSYAQDAYELMKDGTLDAMSVGFSILEKGAQYDDDYRVRTITKAELWEVSIVPFGMNRKAKIRAVKSAGEIQNIRDFESHLRTLGYSQREAKAIASTGFGALHRDGDGSGNPRDVGGYSSETLGALKQMIADNPIKY
jgi:HK97 family phage prohead protease